MIQAEQYVITLKPSLLIQLSTRLAVSRCSRESPLDTAVMGVAFTVEQCSIGLIVLGQYCYNVDEWRISHTAIQPVTC